MERGRRNPALFIMLITKFTERKEKAKERLNICKDCDRYISSTTQCLECKCFMKFKAYWPNSSCPLNKWSSYKKQEQMNE